MTNSRSNLKIAMVGLGAQSLSDHIPAVLRRGDVELGLIYDPMPEAIIRFREKFPNLAKVKVATQRDDLKAVDAAMVAIPHSDYYEVVKQLCSEGISIFKEKPLARNLEEAKRLQKIANFEKLCFVCTQRRYNRLYQKAHEALSLIGTPFMFNAEYKLNILNPNEGWRGDVELAGGGCVLDMGYHIVDQLMWWFGMPQKVFAATSCLATEGAGVYAEDSATIAFEYANGMHGNISLSRSAGEKTERYSVYGSRGSISGNKKSLVIKNKSGETIEEIKLENDNEMMDAQLDYFVTSVRERKGFAAVTARNVANMEFIDRCYKSALAG